MWGCLAGFTGFALAGAISGTPLVRRMPQATLARAFAVLLLVMGAFMLYRNRGAFAVAALVGAASPTGTAVLPRPAQEAAWFAPA